MAGKRKLAIKKLVALFILLVAIGYLSFWLYRKNYEHYRPENDTHKDSPPKTFNMPQDTNAIKHTKNKSASSK